MNTTDKIQYDLTQAIARIVYELPKEEAISILADTLLKEDGSGETTTTEEYITNLNFTSIN